MAVTGASSGIGRATAILAGSLGAELVLIGRSEAKLAETASMTSAKSTIYCVDLYEPEEVAIFGSNFRQRFARIDGFVHAAGVQTTAGISGLSKKTVAKNMRLHFESFLELVQIFAARNVINSTLSIVGVSSVSAHHGTPGKTAYSASKAALEGAVRSLAIELAPRGIRVNAVIPSMVDTNFFRRAIDQGKDENGVSRVLERQYLGLGTPADIAAPIAFLLSPGSRFITGTCLAVDGGRLSS